MRNLGLALFVASIAFGVACADEREETLKQATKQGLEMFKSFNKRKNGVLLETKIKGDPEKNRKVVIEWTLDYNGPRSPLIILTPSLDTGGASRVTAYAVGKNGVLYENRIYAPMYPGAFLRRKESFLRQVKGKALNGTITLELKSLLADFTKKWKEKFEEKPPKIYVQVVHQPTDRGETDELDAWTGELHGPLMELKLTR